jgi:hypothetical protein
MTLPNVPSLSTNAASIDSAPSFLGAIGAPSPELSRQHVQQLIDAAIACDRSLTSTGLSMSVVEDMDAFVHIVEAVGKFVPTVFDRKIKPTRRRGESLGLVVRDHHGEPIATLAVRLFQLQRTLADHLSTLSLFYANPLEQMESGEYLVLRDAARRYASGIEDRVVWIGCFWVSPSRRGEMSNLSGFLPFAARILGMARWGYNTFFSLTESWLRKPHAQLRVGSPDIYETVEWYRPQLPEADRLRRSEILLMAYETKATMSQAAALVAGQNQLWIRPDSSEARTATG